MITQLTPKQLRRAADLKERIDALEVELKDVLGALAQPAAVEAEAPKKRKVSAAARAKVRQAQKERWARIRGEASAPVMAEPKAKRKKKLSAQGIANIRAGVAKRMAKEGIKAAAPVARAQKAVAAPVVKTGMTLKAAILKALASGKEMKKKMLVSRVSLIRGVKTGVGSVSPTLSEMRDKDKTVTNPSVGVWKMR